MSGAKKMPEAPVSSARPKYLRPKGPDAVIRAIAKMAPAAPEGDILATAKRVEEWVVSQVERVYAKHAPTMAAMPAVKRTVGWLPDNYFRIMVQRQGASTCDVCRCHLARGVHFAISFEPHRAKCIRCLVDAHVAHALRKRPGVSNDALIKEISHLDDWQRPGSPEVIQAVRAAVQRARASSGAIT